MSATLVGLLLAAGPAGCDEDVAAVKAPATEVGEAGTSSSADDATALDAGADAHEVVRSTLRVLFIGNSYTYVNDVPGLLTRIAATSNAGPRIVTDSVVKGGAFLSEHLADGVAAQRIAEGTWTHVVLQQQSQFSAGGLDGVRDPAAQTLGAMIVDAGALPTWFVTWAYAPGDGAYYNTFQNPTKMQDLITRGYWEEARKLPGSVLSCVGEAFRSSLRAHPEIALHQADMSHASLAGSYLAAATFYVALTGAPVPDEAEVPAGLAPADAALLRASARVGSGCANLKLRADVHFVNLYGAYVYKPYEVGSLVTPTLDIGVTGIEVPIPFEVVNGGELAADATWALNGPVGWTSYAFPGVAADAGSSIPPCGAVLPPLSRCRLAVSYAPEGPASLAVSLSNAYDDVVSVPIAGTPAPPGRAFLTVGHRPMWPALPSESLVSDQCGPVANLVVSNRGTIATTSLIGRTLTAPFAWGGIGFPGGTGTGTSCPVGRGVDPLSVSLPYCTSVLAPGESCLVGVAMDPSDPAVQFLRVTIGYADAVGASAEDATMTAYVLPPPAPLADAGDASTD